MAPRSRARRRARAAVDGAITLSDVPGFGLTVNEAVVQKRFV